MTTDAPRSPRAGVPRVAVQGEPGCFSHAAARGGWGELSLVPCADFPDLFAAVLEGRADRGVVPVENALAGAVSENLDLLVRHRLVAVGEVYVRVELCLAVRPDLEGDESALTAVASHPVALRQCREFFARHPHLQSVVAADTAGSIRALMEGARGAPADAPGAAGVGPSGAAPGGGPGWDAAIGPALAAELYGARVLRQGIEDDPRNYTRFLVVARPGAEDGFRLTGQEQTGLSKVSLVFTAAHSPGSLHRAIGIFADLGLDLTRMESRPIPGHPWEYRFHADIRGPDADALREAVAALGAVTHRIWELGVYPEARMPGTAARRVAG